MTNPKCRVCKSKGTSQCKVCKWRTLDKALFLLVLTLSAIVALQQFVIHNDEGPKKYLDYPDQKIANHIDGLEIPAVLLDNSVQSQGTKCNNSKAPVKLKGVVFWASVNPAGTTLETGHGSNERKVGCETTSYTTLIPEIVKQKTLDLSQVIQNKCVAWKMTGIETPDNPKILPETWQSETFLICLK